MSASILDFARDVDVTPMTGGGMGKPSMQKVLTFVLVIIAVIALGMFIYNTISRRSIEGSAELIPGKNWVAYFRERCGFCTEQKMILPSDFANFVEHDMSGAQIAGMKNPPPNPPQITGYPTWVNIVTGEKKVGLQSAAALRKMK